MGCLLNRLSPALQESVLSIGWVIGPVVGGYAAQFGGFGAPFFITAALAFVCYPALFCIMPRGAPRHFCFADIPLSCALLLLQSHGTYATDP
jgi:MFS family permease